MPSKKAIRNRTVRRSTLRTVVDRVKTSRRSARAAKPSASGTSRTRVAKRRSSLAPRTIVVGTLCVVAAAALVMSRKTSVVNWEAEVDAAGNVHRLERVDAFDPAPAKAARTAPAPAAAAEPQARLVPASLRTTESEPEAASPSAPAPSHEAAAAVPATIAGCLQRDENTFWLKNVSGDDAPKARSWKSGFIRKTSPSIELVDGGSNSRLAAYVGRRIETTGALADREMHVKTLRVLGACE